MDICSAHGEEIAYVKNCPACDEITDLKREIDSLKERIERLEEGTE